jgi:uracil-DNA glycosylase
MFNQDDIDSSWQPLVTKALATVDQDYLRALQIQTEWLPGAANIFNAFSLPLSQTRYILFGESPYPRQASANGFAFWDNAVGDIWAPTGLTKAVNRATSLRNFIKMLLHSDGYLSAEATGQAEIATLDKSKFVTTLPELFSNLLTEGFLLLNASLVLSETSVRYDSKHWQPFIQSILRELILNNHDIKLILMGNVAKNILALPGVDAFSFLQTEHPYNLSFIHNKKACAFFKQFNLLKERDKLR